MSDSDLVSGLYFKEPHQNAPDFVKGKLSINKEQFTEWYKGMLADKSEEWINLDIKVSKGGKAYVAVDTWKPDGATSPSNDLEDLPF